MEFEIFYAFTQKNFGFLMDLKEKNFENPSTFECDELIPLLRCATASSTTLKNANFRKKNASEKRPFFTEEVGAASMFCSPVW